MRIGGVGKRKKKWRTIDFCDFIAYHRKREKIGREPTKQLCKIMQSKNTFFQITGRTEKINYLHNLSKKVLFILF